MKGTQWLMAVAITLASTSLHAFDNIEAPVNGNCEDSHMLIMDACVWKPYVSTRNIRDLQNEIKRFKASHPADQTADITTADSQS